MLMSFICWGIAVLFIVIGICSIYSKKPSGIYSNVKAPDENIIIDLKAYNRAVGMMIIGYALLFVISGFLVPYVNESQGGIIILLCAFPGAIAMMIIYEVVIVPKYVKQKK